MAGWRCFLAITFVVVACGARKVMGGNLYLYHGEGDASPVVDYLVPEEGINSHPDFLYHPNSASTFTPPARVVEFYAPWCGHCQHFAPHYKALAREITASNPEVRFHAVSCSAHGDLCKEQKVNGYPTVKMFREGSYEGEVVTGSSREDAGHYLRYMGLAAGDGDPDAAAGTGEGAGDATALAPVRVVPFRALAASDAWSDAAASFRYGLAHSIYVENGPLSREKRDALRDWLALLDQSLPQQMGSTRYLVAGLQKRFEYVADGQKNLDEVVRVLRSSPEEPTWRTCTHEDNTVAGYTCGLWQLFHIMAAGVVEYNRHNTPMPTRHAAETLRNYIDHFFQCDICRINFLSMYDTCAFDGCHRLSETPSSLERDWRELPLWLWETHNDVNVRLLGERLEENQMDKPTQWESQQARWPSLYMCPNCWRKDGSWEDDEVFDHLHESHWTGSPIHTKITSTVVSSPPRRVVSFKSILAVGLLAVTIFLLRKTRRKRKKRRYKK